MRHYHEYGTARPSRQGQGRKSDRRWIFGGEGGKVSLTLLEGIKDAGDCEDLLIEVWSEFLIQSPTSPAYRSAVAQLQYTRKLLSSLARQQDEAARDAFYTTASLRHGAHQLVFTDETARDDRTLNRRYAYGYS